MKPLSTFSVTLKLWLHSDMCIWASSFWIERTLRVWVSPGNLAKQQGSPELVSDYGAQRGGFRGLSASEPKSLEPSC